MVTHAAPCFFFHLMIAIVIAVTILDRKNSATELAAALMAAPVKIKDRMSHLQNEFKVTLYIAITFNTVRF